MLERKSNVVRYEEVEMTIAVVIQKSTSGSPSHRPRFPESGLLGHIRKSAVAIIAVEAILSVIGTEDVVEAVIVVIGDTHTVCPTHGSESCLIGHIRKRSVAIILIEAIGRFGRIALQPPAGKQQDIHPSVVVVINESATAPVRLHNVFLAVHSSIDDRH